MFQFEEQRVTDFGPCECCGDISRHVRGLVRLNDELYAAYEVHWTMQKVASYGAEFYIILGKWGEDTTAADKFAVALHYFVEPDRSGFAVVDADKTSISSDPLVGRGLPRASVIDTPLATEVFDLVDAIWLEDENIAEVRDAVAPPSA